MRRQLFAALPLSAVLFASALLLAAPLPAQAPAPAPSQQSPLAHNRVQVRILGHIHKKELRQLQKAWLPSVQQQLRANWRPLQPQSTQPPMQASGATVLVASLTPQGKVAQLTVTQTSDNVALDEAARGAVQSAAPFPPFPPGLKEQDIRVQCEFLYNWSIAPSTPSR